MKRCQLVTASSSPKYLKPSKDVVKEQDFQNLTIKGITYVIQM
jgi:hypothetical protein